MEHYSHIAIDLDNTLLNTTRACITHFNNITGITLNSDDEFHYRYYEFYGWNEEMYEYVYERFGNEIHWASHPYPGAVETVKKLYDNYQLTILTARPDLFTDVTLKWLNHHEIPFHRLIFDKEKFMACESLNIDVLIDDAPHYAKEFTAKGRRFLIMDQPYNRNIDHDLMHRVKDWTQVAKIIAEL
jgi:uncharacterized HAD superfamily protein